MTKQNAASHRDRALLDAVRRRDRAAFTELYRLYHRRLFGYLRRFLADQQLIEEVIDDVMFVVWKDARRFEGQSAVSSWIFGIAYRKAMSALRIESRREAGLDRQADTDRIAAVRPRGGELVKKALTKLSPEHRQVVELTYYFGFSYREIAEIAGCPENTVKTRMYHARRKLKVILPVLSGKKEDQGREQA